MNILMDVGLEAIARRLCKTVFLSNIFVIGILKRSIFVICEDFKISPASILAKNPGFSKPPTQLFY